VKYTRANDDKIKFLICSWVTRRCSIANNSMSNNIVEYEYNWYEYE